MRVNTRAIISLTSRVKGHDLSGQRLNAHTPSLSHTYTRVAGLAFSRPKLTNLANLAFFSLLPSEFFENLLSSWPFFQVYAYLVFDLFSKSLFSKIQTLAFFSYKLLATLTYTHCDTHTHTHIHTHTLYKLMSKLSLSLSLSRVS